MKSNSVLQIRTYDDTKKLFQSKIEQNEELKKLKINTMTGAIGHATNKTYGVNIIKNYLPTGEEDDTPHADHYYEEP